MRVFEGTLKVLEFLDACSCGSVTGRPHGNRIGRDRERGLGGRLEQETADDAQLIRRAPGAQYWRLKAIQAVAQEDRTRSEGVWMRSAGQTPAGVETGADSIRPGTCLRASHPRRSCQSAEA
jgi:hypothetical protein